MARTVYKIGFQVQGSGDFPIDMLRYDRCYPMGEHDSHLIENLAFSEPKGERIIELIHYSHDKEWAPTGGRWKSRGGWTVRVIFPAGKFE